jgi:bifunctional UDP-N-acetylglucosamine pyrophosphorylase/glucosamine-1-phosphate N-acetyltransferase
MQAIILAAGRGTRLAPLTDIIPKPLIPVQGRPILEHIIKALPPQIDEVIIVVGYKGDALKNYFGTYYDQRKITYADQGKTLGTYGALLSAKQYIHTGSFLVMGADDIQDREALEKMIALPLAFGIQIKKLPSKNYLIVDIENDRVRGFKRPTEEEFGRPQPIATGTYILDERLWSHPPVEVIGGEYGLPQTMVPMLQDCEVQAVDMPYWIQINSHDELAEAQGKTLS